MSFQFAFAAEDDVEMELDEGSSDAVHVGAPAPAPAHDSALASAAQAKEWSLQSLLDTLPPSLSYSPIAIPIDTSAPSNLLHLARRDLFDARFQMLHDDSDEDASTRQAATTAVGSDSDLVPGVYEGGLKTWECAADLIAELHSRIHRTTDPLAVQGSKVIELGCGTALPSLFVLSQLLGAPQPPPETPSSALPSSQLHLADFNPEVLKLVTVPNLILTWFFFSPAAAPFRAGATEDQPSAPSPANPGDLTLTPALLTAFTADLAARQIHIRLFSGPWASLAPVLYSSSQQGAVRPYDLVLTSETVYSLDTLPSLVHILYTCSTGTGAESEANDAPARAALCLVAAKILYFGVGGGVHSFVRAIESEGPPLRDERRRRNRPAGSCQTVREVRAGVGRAVLQADW